MARSQAPPLLHYALAPLYVALATLVHVSPAGPFLHPTGLFVLAVVAAGWFGGPGPGFFAALLATLVVPQLIPISYPLTAGWLDLPRFVTFAITGLAVGWGATRSTRAAALQRSEERYAMAMNASDEGFWDWDVATDDFHASPRMLEMCGFPHDTVFASRADFLSRFPFAPGERARWQEGVTAHFAGKSARFDLEIGILCGGATRWIHATGMATRDASGALVRWTGAMRDVTARRSMEQALRHSEQRYAVVMEASDEGFWDWDVATDEFYASPRMLEMYGFPPDTRFAGRADFIQRFAFHPEDQPKWEQAVAAHFAGESARFDIEIRMLRHGETRCFHLTGLASRDAYGAVVRWTGSTSDITDRKRAEEALRLSEERYAFAMEAAQDAHWDWIVGTDEYYTSPRVVEVFGLPPGTSFTSRQDYLAKTPLVKEDMQAWLSAARELFAGTGSRLSMELRAMIHGEIRWIQHNGVCLRDASGRAVRWCGTVRDVTERRRTMEALRLSEERYARALEGSNEGIWEWNLVTGELFESPHARQLYGIADGVEIRTRADLEAHARFHPADRHAIQDAIQDCLARRSEGFDIEYRILHQAGETRWLRCCGKVFLDADDQPARITGSVSDVTDRKRVEDALRDSEERYARALKASADGIWEWSPASDRMYVSPRARELFGVADEVQIDTRARLRAEIRFHPEDRQRTEHTIQASLARRAGGFDMEYRVIDAVGEMRWLRTRAKVFADAEGAPALVTGSLTDITTRKRAEEALRESEKRYERAMLAAEAGFWDWYIPSDAFYLSPKLLEMGGFAPGTTFVDRASFMERAPFHPEDRPKWQRAVQELFAGSGSRLSMELRVLIGGEVRWHNLNGICFRDAEGKVVRWTGSSTDITERKRAEEALRLSEQRYAHAMEGSDAGHWDWNLVSDEMFVSKRAREMLALPDGPLPAQRDEIMALVPQHPDDRALMPDKIQVGIESGSHEREYRVIPRPGEARWLRSRGKVFRDERGVPVRLTGSLLDITERKLAADALRASEERYALAMEASQEGHYDWNVQTDEIFVSPKTYELVGLPADVEHASRTEFIRDIPYHPEDRACLFGQLAAVLAGPALRHEFEYRIVVNGEARWLTALWLIQRDAQGAALRVICVLNDITERRLAADELRESEARFRSLTDLSSDYYWRLDENLRFTYMSDQAYTLRAYPEESPLGKTRWELPGLTPLSCSWAEHQATLAARQPFRDLELSRVVPDGSVGYFSVSGAPMFDGQGRFKGYQGVGRHITERKRIEEELRSRQEMLELAQKSARAIAFEWRIGPGGEGENRWSSDLEAMYGLAPGTYDGSYENWKKLLHPDDWPAVKEALQHAQRTGEVAAEYRVVHPDGSVHWLQARGRMFFDGAGKPTRMVGFMQDVTDRRHAEEELRKMERELRRAQRLEAMGTLAGGIAHDFNNILGAILGYGEMAQRGAKKGTRLQRDLDSIMSAGERGRALVDRILAFSRSGVGERVAVHVEAVVREALDLLAGDLPRGVRVRADLRAGRAAMLGDPTQVHQVVMNLASNAVQAMSKGGLLRVSLERVRFESARAASVGAISAGEYLVLKVTDAGSGIRAEVLERMFDPFFTTKEVGVGSGLGLSLVHGIVSNVGGAIDVATELGKGTTFTVYLPRSGDALEQRKDQTRSLPRGDGQRVLVVDDEEPLVRLATETLEGLGYATAGFTSSVHALKEFGANPGRFDAILTDERMPGVTGSTIIQEVRRINASIPILLMSGYVGAAAALKARELGADDVLRKPLLARELAASLARVLHH